MRVLVSALTISLLLSACANAPVGEPSFSGKYRNACLPEAAAMCEGLQDAGIEAKVLLIRSTKSDHAITVYLYPSGRNTLWGWDSYWKSVRLRAWFGDADSVAIAWLKKTLVSTKLIKAEYLEP